MSTEELITYEQIEKHLLQWSQYINSDDLAILKKFVYNTTNNIEYNKLLIFCGQGCTGKSTLTKELISLIGKDDCVYTSVVYKSDTKTNENALDSVIDHCTKKLIVYHDYNTTNEICDVNIKNILSRKSIYGKKLYQSPENYYPKANQILITHDINKLNEELLMCSDVIYFTHVFK
jgi:hypothetical protein